MKELKEKIRREWTPKPLKAQFAEVVAMVIIVGALVLGVKFGIVVGGVFFAACLVFSLFVGYKWNI